MPLESPEETLGKYRNFVTIIDQKKGRNFTLFLRSLLVFFDDWDEITPLEARSLWLRALDKLGRHGWYALYLGMPYCKTRCSYCVYNSFELKTQDQLETYSNNLIKEMQFFAPLFNDVKFESFYFGGGTPSLLEPDGLDRIFGTTFGMFKLIPGAEKSIEFTPLSTTTEKLEVAKKWGVNKVSFGVQSLNRKVLDIANRQEQETRHVEFALQEARRLGFKNINVDLIMGLTGDTEESFLDTFRRVAAMGPTRISIYPLQPLKNYIERAGESSDEIGQRVRTMLANVSEDLLGIAKEHDFLISGKMAITKDVTNWGFTHKSLMNERGAYFFDNPAMHGCIGFGPISISRAKDMFWYQQETHLGHRLDVPFDPTSRTYRKREMSARTNMVAYVLDCLSSPDGIMELATFREKFGVDFREVFQETVNDLETLGRAKTDDGKFRLTTDAHKEAFISCMFFFDMDKIEEKMRRITTS
ncbi:MAG: radical SAM protein [Candidatus Aenigmatarchaeota archaeon]